MTIPTIAAFDATSIHEPLLSQSVLAAGYDTQLGGGTGFIAWTPAQWNRHLSPYPAIHIDQDQNASDTLADWLDVEAGAATASEIVSWITRARAAFAAKTRPGQRWPGIYCSQSNVQSLVALLVQAHLTNVPFWVANYNYTLLEANNVVATALGPYPAAGFQYTDKALNGNADADVFSLPWVKTTAGGAPVTTPVTGVQKQWAWCKKCQGLFYKPNQAKSVCPAGGPHVITSPTVYELNYETP